MTRFPTRFPSHRPSASPSHRRLVRRGVTLLLVSMLVASTSACLPKAKIGARCRNTGFSSDAGWLLTCVNGRWTKGVSVQQAVQLLALAQRPVPSFSGGPIRILVAGDSTAHTFGMALQRYSIRHPEVIQVVDMSLSGCPVTRVEAIRNYTGEIAQSTAHCNNWAPVLHAKVQEFRPDVSLVVDSLMEQSDHRMAPDQPWRNVLDPAWADYQRAEYGALADVLSSAGGAVFWADVPVMRFLNRTWPWISENPLRTAMLNQNLARFASERPGIELLPLAARLDRPGFQIDWYTRPDGIHLSPVAADIEVGAWLVPVLVQRFRSPVPPTPPPAG